MTTQKQPIVSQFVDHS